MVRRLRQMRRAGEIELPDRRHALAGLAAVTFGPLAATLASAQGNGPASEAFQAHFAALTRGRAVAAGRVILDVPRLAESGNSVPLKVSVESPMTAGDHVAAIHLLSERNPIAAIGSFRLSRFAGRAEITTNIRLATTQNVHAIAETSDGRLWGASTEVVVLLAACLDAG